MSKDSVMDQEVELLELTEKRAKLRGQLESFERDLETAEAALEAKAMSKESIPDQEATLGIVYTVRRGDGRYIEIEASKGVEQRVYTPEGDLEQTLRVTKKQATLLWQALRMAAESLK